MTSHRYGSSKKRSSSTSPSARKRKEPLRAATPAPTRSPKPLYLPPHGRARGSLRPPEPEQPPQERRGRSPSPLQRRPAEKEAPTAKYVPPHRRTNKGAGARTVGPKLRKPRSRNPQQEVRTAAQESQAGGASVVFGAGPGLRRHKRGSVRPFWARCSSLV